MQLRAIRRGKPGKYSRNTFRTLLRAVHVLETSPGGDWEVRTLGERGHTERFAARDQAITFALKAKDDKAKVIVHQSQPKRVTVAQLKKSGSQTTIQESELR